MKKMIPPWLQYALGSFLCFGITNSLLGAIFEWSGRNPSTPVTAPFIVWLTMGLFGVGTALIFGLTGRGFRGIPTPRLAWVAALAGLFLSLGMLTLKLGLSSDPGSKGPIVAITSTNAMLVAVGAWVFLKEKLSRMQLTGMLVIVSGIIFMALGQGSETSLRGFLFGLATMLFFGITNFLLKYAGHKGMNSVTATAILWLSSGLCGALAVAGCLLLYGNLPGLEHPSLLLWSALAGISLSLGMLFIKLAVTKGPAGPATAVTGSNSVLVALFEFFVFAHIPPTPKIIGMAITIGGIIFLSLGVKKRA
jgi:transporter family protein